MRQVTHAHKVAPESCNKPSGAIFVSWYLFRREKSWYTENDNSEFMEVIKMKEYQYLIGKIIVAMAIIVAAIIIAQAIGGAGESIRSGLLQLGDALR